MTASLTASQLARMRAVAQMSLPDTCTIQSKTNVADDMGGSSETYSDTATNVPCRVKVTDRAPDELVRDERAGSALKYVVTLPYNQSLENTDRIIWNSRTLEVIDAMRNSWQIHMMYFCIEVR